MNYPGKEQIEMLRKRYPVGTKVVLEDMDDPHAPPAGTIGEVQGVDDMAQIMVHWQNGSTLSLIPGVDSFRKEGDEE